MTMSFKGWSRILLEPFTRLKKVRVSVESLKSLLVFAALALILVSAFLIRLLPAKWGVYIHEFDPYFQYRVTKKILDEGFTSWLNWRDYKSWYPYGRDMTRTLYPGLPMTAAVLYLALRVLGVSITLYEFLCYFPIIAALATCVTTFYLGKEYGGVSAALLSSFLMAVSPAYISRTHLGWFDDETVGVLALTLITLFYVRALDPGRRLKSSLVYALLTGLSLGYLFASWGTARYALGLLALATLLVALKDCKPKYIAVYGIAILVGLAIAVNIPRIGGSIIREATGVASIGLLPILVFGLLVKRFREPKSRLAVVTVFAGVLVLGSYGAWTLGYMDLPTKYLTVVQPLARAGFPLIRSVGEYRPATWVSFFTSLGFLPLLIPVYIFMAVYNPENKHLLLLTYLLTALYSAASYVRLELVLAPPACLAGAYTVDRFIKHMAGMIKPKPSTRRRVRVLGREVAVAFTIIILLISVAPSVYFGLTTADSPVTIVNSSVPVKEFRGDWLEALKWLKENVPDEAVVMSWWDYGYWITIMANKTTLADNATINSTQIAVIARAFMSPEEEAIKIMKKYNVSYVAVFVDFLVATYGGVHYYIAEGFGEENKFIWMIRIAGLNETEYVDNDGRPTERFFNSLLGRLIPFRYDPTLRAYTGPVFHRSEHIELAFRSSSVTPGGRNGRVTGVVIYRVNYGEESA